MPAPDASTSWPYFTRALICEQQARVDDDSRIAWWWEAICYLERAILLDDSDSGRWAAVGRCHRLLENEACALDATAEAVEGQIHGDQEFSGSLVIGVGGQVGLQVLDRLVGVLQILGMLRARLIHRHVGHADVLGELLFGRIETHGHLVARESCLILAGLEELVAAAKGAGRMRCVSVRGLQRPARRPRK